MKLSPEASQVFESSIRINKINDSERKGIEQLIARLPIVAYCYIKMLYLILLVICLDIQFIFVFNIC